MTHRMEIYFSPNGLDRANKRTLGTDYYLVKSDIGKNTLHLLKPQPNLENCNELIPGATY